LARSFHCHSPPVSAGDATDGDGIRVSLCAPQRLGALCDLGFVTVITFSAIQR
jgi:hypothetical protein